MLASRGSPDIFFFAAEGLSYLLLCLLSYSTWRLRSPRLANPESQPLLSVDILVPCCGEPLEIIQTTLRAVRRITYHPLEVYVLDDAASEEVAALAQSLGFHYLSRPQAGLPGADSKSGNLNFGMSRSCGELIPVLDADQVPAPEIFEPAGRFFQSVAGGLCPEQASLFLAGRRSLLQPG